MRKEEINSFPCNMENHLIANKADRANEERKLYEM